MKTAFICFFHTTWGATGPICNLDFGAQGALTSLLVYICSKANSRRFMGNMSDVLCAT